MIDHITIRVKNLEKSRAFYEKVLAPLGYIQNIGSADEGYYAFGTGEDPIFEIAQATDKHPAHTQVHIAFKAKNIEQIDAFYQTAIANGATDNGKPGPRKEYTPSYYAAFVYDLDQNNIEACMY